MSGLWYAKKVQYITKRTVIETLSFQLEKDHQCIQNIMKRKNYFRTLMFVRSVYTENGCFKVVGRKYFIYVGFSLLFFTCFYYELPFVKWFKIIKRLLYTVILVDILWNHFKQHIKETYIECKKAPNTNPCNITFFTIFDNLHFHKACFLFKLLNTCEHYKLLSYRKWRKFQF